MTKWAGEKKFTCGRTDGGIPSRRDDSPSGGLNRFRRNILPHSPKRPGFPSGHRHDACSCLGKECVNDGV